MPARAKDVSVMLHAPASAALCVLCAALLSACAALPGRDERKEEAPPSYAIVTAHPLATEAGAAILAEGGSAADAAVAVTAVLGLVEPQSAGIGGGAFLLYWDADRRRLRSFDGRETAPASTRPDQFLGPDGTPLPFDQQVIGGQSVGVPGAVPMLARVHNAYGRLDWADLFAPAERLADRGFEVSPRLALVTGYMESLAGQPATRDYFYGGGKTPLAAGTVKTNPAYAATLRALAADPKALHRGAIAEAITAAALDGHSGQPNLTLADLAGYAPKERPPVCGPYRTYTICGMGPPSSGGVTMLQILGILQHFDLDGRSPEDAQVWHLFAEAQKLAFADRNLYLGDPDFIRMPIDGLIGPAYLRARARLIDAERASPARHPGLPSDHTAALAPADDRALPSTTHFSIRDGYGDIVSMTASIEGPFGSHIMTEGFLLNNELTDFSAVPERGGVPVANAPGPGRRPLSSMSPTIVFDENGTPLFVIGSPGGTGIIAYVAKTLIGVLDLKLSAQEAIDLPNVVDRNRGSVQVEDSPEGRKLAKALTAAGHTVELTDRLTSGLNGILVSPIGAVTAADPRREGTGATGRAETRTSGFLSRLGLR